MLIRAAAFFTLSSAPRCMSEKDTMGLFVTWTVSVALGATAS